MTRSFLDTTVVIDVADSQSPNNTHSVSYLAVNTPVEFPYYALRELLAGHLRILCDVHNRVKTSTHIGEALLSLTRMNPIAGRKKSSALDAFAVSLSRRFSASSTGDRSDLKREVADDLALHLTRIWMRARRAKNMSVVQPLACFEPGDLVLGEAGELRGPRSSFNCAESARCEAAAYIFDDQSTLSKMIAALHPDSLGEQANKGENKQRRKALKDLASSGPLRFNKRGCRALGDAYFAAMCPPGAAVVTSNTIDFEPICNALGKAVAKPI